MNGQTRQRKGKVTTSPRAKAKVKARARKKHPRKGNHNQDQTGSPNEDGQRTLGDFGIKRQRVEFVGDVQENDDFESPRLDPAAYVFCVQKCNSISMDSTELPSSSKRVCDGYEEPAGTHAKFDQSTGEVLFAVGCRDDRPIVDSGSVVSACPVDYATSVPTETVQYSMNLESVLVNLCNIMAIFMSMFNDISWGSEDNEQECELNERLVSIFAKRFSPGRWSFLGPGSEKKWCSTHEIKPQGI